MKSLFILQLVCCVITAMLALQLAMASLQASVLGSSDKLKRYMRLYVDRGEPHLLTGKNRDDILREFDITEHVPQ